MKSWMEARFPFCDLQNVWASLKLKWDLVIRALNILDTSSHFDTLSSKSCGEVLRIHRNHRRFHLNSLWSRAMSIIRPDTVRRGMMRRTKAACRNMREEGIMNRLRENDHYHFWVWVKDLPLLWNNVVLVLDRKTVRKWTKWTQSRTCFIVVDCESLQSFLAAHSLSIEYR